ncbi:MAG: TonB-dependent receptor [Porticoccaceae bacterium]|nr:TonB-dependent receptor [Porticoccaceae bacterium]
MFTIEIDMTYLQQALLTYLRPTRLTSITGLLLLSLNAGANDAELYSESDFFDPIPTVEAATRHRTPLSHTPASVTVITREMIDALPSNNFIDILKLVPGFQVFFANGSIQAVTINGQNDRFPKRLEIRIDGRSVYTPINSALSWESLGLNINDISGMEVVRGSNIAVYGANAAQGAINILTRDPLSESGSEVSYTSGDRNTHNFSARHSFKSAAAAYTLRTHYRENQGFDGLDDQSYVDSAALQGVYTPSPEDEFQWDFGYSDGSFGFGDGDHVEEFADEEVDTQWFAISWRRLAGAHTIKLRSSANLGNYDRSRLSPLTDVLGVSLAQLEEAFPGEPNQLIETEEGRREYEQYDFELEDHIALNGGSNFLWGLGLRHQKLTAPSEFSSKSSSSESVYFFFSNIDWHFNNYWEAHLGFLVEKHNSDDGEISPRLSINYHLNETQHFRISGSLAHRQPSLYEKDRVIQTKLSSGTVIDLSYIADPDLGSERFETYEFAYLGYWFDRRLSVDYRLFREYLEDAIRYIKHPYDDINGKFRQLESTDSINISGYETQIQWRPDSSWLISGQYYNSRVLLSYRSAKHIASLLVSKQLPFNWQVSGAFYHQSSISWRRGTDVPSWHRYDIKVSKGWQLNAATINLALIIQNLSDEEYIEYQAGNLFEQTTLLNLKISF